MTRNDEHDEAFGCAIPQSVFEDGTPGLLYELNDRNAPRSCGECGEDADYYIFVDDRVSKSLCADCLREAPTVE